MFSKTVQRKSQQYCRRRKEMLGVVLAFLSDKPENQGQTQTPTQTGMMRSCKTGMMMRNCSVAVSTYAVKQELKGNDKAWSTVQAILGALLSFATRLRHRCTLPATLHSRKPSSFFALSKSEWFAASFVRQSPSRQASRHSRGLVRYYEVF